MTNHGNHNHHGNHRNRLFDNTAARLLDNANMLELRLWKREDDDVSLVYEIHGELCAPDANDDDGDEAGGLLAVDKPDRSADMALIVDLLKRFLEPL